MIGRFFIAFLLIAMTTFCTGPDCTAGQDVVTPTAHGFVNWTRGLLNARGTCAPARKRSGRVAGSQKALATAKDAAYKNLLNLAKEVRIDNALTVGVFAEENDAVMTKLTDIVKHAAIIDQRFLANGTAEVIVEMSLLGGFAQLVLPVDIEHVESIQPFKTQHADDLAKPEPAAPKKEIYSGFIVDARGIRIDPVLTPEILDENWQEVYGPSFVSREIAVQKGMSQYENDMASARSALRAGENPLVVKGLRTKGLNGIDIIISNADALKIKGASEHLEALKQCRVIIVVDAPKKGKFPL